jgi:hypothetical protein
MTRRFLLLFGAATGAGCSQTPVAPDSPVWADVAPVLRGQCNGCHGWTAQTTGSGYRLDFFNMTTATCGDATLALGSGLFLAGSPGVSSLIKTDVVTQGGDAWPRMPPQPSPALPAWERDTLENWGAHPLQGDMPAGNRPPTLELYDVPSTADKSLSFTVVLEDPDADAALGVIEANGQAVLMNRTGSFSVSFDTSTWPAGSQPVNAVLCDGWLKSDFTIGTVQISHSSTSKP